MWLLFECKIGAGNAYLLSEALAMTPLNKPLLKEFHQKCLESQEVISAQIPWASASADRSRVAKNQEQNENILTDNKGLETSMLTWEEELLSEILAANERLLSALRLYDDLGRLAVEPDVETITEEAEEATASPDTSGNDRSSRPHTQAVVAAPAFPTLPATDPPPTTPHGLGTLEDIPVGHSYPFKVKALKAFTADPDDPDEISFIQGEILDILDKQGKWWLIQNEEGSVGIASSDYFSVFDGGDLQTETRRSSAGEPVYPYSTAENGKSFSEEEIFDVVEEQIQWWQATKPSGSTSGLSSNYSIVSWSEPQTFQHKAQALYNYTADRNDPREISFCQGEILDIGDKRADWWQARNTKGLVGIAPSNYLQLL
ncbi:hypothetical protein B0H13DRAFT_1135852 [Mycena leptocephala]|nr:hypothetical protein B0H13DRAFT_1135852 [Mycena leptocephala]